MVKKNDADSPRGIATETLQVSKLWQAVGPETATGHESSGDPSREPPSGPWAMRASES